jgi:hypothetical protein
VLTNVIIAILAAISRFINQNQTARVFVSPGYYLPILLNGRGYSKAMNA